jgi:hypothetical protein
VEEKVPSQKLPQPRRSALPLGISHVSVKAMRQKFRGMLLVVGGLVCLITIATLCLFVYVQRPHIEVTEVRATPGLQTVQVTWSLQCEDEHFEDDHNQRYSPNIPVGGKEPYIGPVPKSGTSFVLVGYPYMALNRNRFTGKVEKQRSERFDVIEWHVVTPYFIWDGTREVESNEPVGWKIEEATAQFVAQTDRPHRGC